MTFKHCVLSFLYYYFIGITDSDERQECLKLASEAGLDIPVITKHLVENIRSRDWPDYNTTATDMPHDIATTQVCYTTGSHIFMSLTS